MFLFRVTIPYVNGSPLLLELAGVFILCLHCQGAPIGSLSEFWESAEFAVIASWEKKMWVCHRWTTCYFSLNLKSACDIVMDFAPSVGVMSYLTKVSQMKWNHFSKEVCT